MNYRYLKISGYQHSVTIMTDWRNRYGNGSSSFRVAHYKQKETTNELHASTNQQLQKNLAIRLDTSDAFIYSQMTISRSAFAYVNNVYGTSTFHIKIYENRQMRVSL